MLLFGIKKRWETGTNQPNGGELQYNATQKYGTQELTFQNMIVLFAMDY